MTAEQIEANDLQYILANCDYARPQYSGSWSTV